MKLINVESNCNYVLKTGLLINGNGQPVSSNATIYIENGEIAALATNGNSVFSFKYPDRETVVFDLSDLAVMPPLVDCHVHLALDGVNFTAARERWEDPEQVSHQVQAELQDTIRHGILAVRDGGDRAEIGLHWQNKLTGEHTTPVIRSPGFALRKPGTYGSFLGCGVNMDNLDQALDSLAAKQVDHVKVIVSGVVSFKEYGVVGSVQYSAEELASIVAGARARGLPVMAHASSDAAVRLAVEAGVDTVEHGYFLTRESLALMAERKTRWIPTVVPVAARLDCDEENGGPGREERLVVEKTVDHQLAMISEAVSLGVLLGVGTDAGATGVCHGSGYLKELALYSRAGLAPAEIIRCATLNGAGILGLDWGNIEPGRPAALIAVEGNPLDDVNALAGVKYAFMPHPQQPCPLENTCG